MSQQAPDDEKTSLFEIEVAPLLTKAAAICKKHNISFAAFVELTNNTAEASYYTKDMTFAFQLGALAFRCGGNIDALTVKLIEIAKKNGHKSAYLKALGIPEVPEAPTVPPVPPDTSNTTGP